MAKKKNAKNVEDTQSTQSSESLEEKIDKVEVITERRKINKKYGKVGILDLIQRDPFLPRAIENKIRKDIKRMRAITANELAQQYNVRVSAMKKFLLTLEKEGLIERIASSSRVKIFNPVE